MSHHVVSIRLYLAVFFSLMVLTAVTVWVAFLDFGPLNDILAMGIAIFKASLVILYFMHVRYNSKLTWAFVASGFFWLVLLLVLTGQDYWSRDWDKTKGWDQSPGWEDLTPKAADPTDAEEGHASEEH